jgi:hypothetical protein
VAGQHLTGGERQRVLGNMPHGGAQVNTAVRLVGKVCPLVGIGLTAVGHSVTGGMAGVAGADGVSSRACVRSSAVQGAKGLVRRCTRGRTLERVRTKMCGMARVLACTGVLRALAHQPARPQRAQRRFAWGNPKRFTARRY